MEHRTVAELDQGLDHIRRAPTDAGRLELIVRRPAIDEREVLDQGVLDPDEGLVGDTWRQRPSRSTPDGGPHPDAQVTVVSARALEAVGGPRDRWPLAGDQLYVDLDLSVTNLPAGSRLTIGDAVLEVTAKPHTGCSKFSARYGVDAVRWVNSTEGKELRLRGLNARVVTGGTIRAGDKVTVERP